MAVTVAGCNSLLQAISVPPGTGGNLAKTQATVGPSPTAAPTASPGGPTPTPAPPAKLVPAFSDQQNQGLRVNTGVSATFMQIPKTSDANANVVLDALGTVMGAPSVAMGLTIESQGSSAVDTSTQIASKEDLLAKLNSLPIPKDADFSASFFEEPAFLSASFSTQALRWAQGVIQLGTREAPTIFTPDLLPFLPAGTKLAVYGTITDAAQGMTISEMRIKEGSKVVTRDNRTLVLEEDTGLGFSTIMTYSGGITAGMGFYEPFTRAGTLYLMYKIAPTATGGTISAKCSFYVGGWKYVNGVYQQFTADSQQAQDFKSLVGDVKTAKVDVTYTKKTRYSGEIEATISDVKTFGGQTLIGAAGIKTPKATVYDVANQIADAFTNNQ